MEVLGQQGAQSAQPFGWDFANSDDMQPPDSAISTESLLKPHEHHQLTGFWNNPDDPSNSTIDLMANLTYGDVAMGNTAAQTFAIPEAMHTQDWSTPGDFVAYPQIQSQQDFRPQSANDFMRQLATQPMHRMSFGGMPQVSAPLDESHIGANALFNLSQNSPLMQRPNSQRRFSEFSPSHAHPSMHQRNILSASQYPPISVTKQDPKSPMSPIPLPSFSGEGIGHIPAALATPTSGPSAIPTSLQFDTDSSFTKSNTNYEPVEEYDRKVDESLITAMVYTAYPPLKNPTNSLTRSTAAALRALRRGQGIKVEDEDDDVQAKRRRTKSFPAVGSDRGDLVSPVSATFMNSAASPADSTGSSGTSRSDTPRAGRGALARRRSSAINAAAGAAANSKRLKLSDKQRKENHIQSEKRRRAEMKKGYDTLDKLVPSLKSGGLSKAQILQQTVVFLESLVEGNKLIEAALKDGAS